MEFAILEVVSAIYAGLPLNNQARPPTDNDIKELQEQASTFVRNFESEFSESAKNPTSLGTMLHFVFVKYESYETRIWNAAKEEFAQHNRS